MPRRTTRHPFPIRVGFMGDATDYVVLNWSRTGMLVDYDGDLAAGDEGTMVRMSVSEAEGMEPVQPRRFRVVRRDGMEMAVDFFGMRFRAGFDLTEVG